MSGDLPGVRSRGPRVAPRLALSKATFPIAPEECASPRRAPFRKSFVSRRCINIQMPLRITHCRALAVKVHRRFYSPATAPARSRVPCEGSPARRAASPRGRRGEPTQQSHSHFAAGSSPVDAQVIELTMAKTFVASMARGLGALLLITLALETQANRARPASPVSFRERGRPPPSSASTFFRRPRDPRAPAQARSSRRRTGASTSSPPASAPSSRPTASARTTWPTASRRPSAPKP